ncbi:MAG: polysaccharide export protein [Terrimicrobiaceae bacterium]|nr:polysaccharide export protein [Terrimicrobiaceae bacterium]
MPFRLVALSLCAIAILLTGCASTKSDSTVPTLAEMAEDTDNVLNQNIRLRSGDTIEVRLGGVPREEIEQVTGTYTVDTEGFVNIPQLGRIEASGLTQEALQSSIESTYRAKGVYTNPTVTVSVPLSARFVNVGGEVRLPQRVPYTPDLTVLAAVTAAGGFTEYASQSRVKLYRNMEGITVDMRKIRKDPGNDIPLQPGDTIEVMRSYF